MIFDKIFQFPSDVVKRDNIMGILIGLSTIIISLAASRLDTTLVAPIIPKLLNYLIFALVILSLVFSKKKQFNIVFFIPVFIYWFLCAFYQAQGADLGIGLRLLVIYIVYSCMPKKQWIVALRVYRFIFIVICFLGCISYISFAFNLGIPYSIASFYGNAVSVNYINYGFSYLTINSEDGIRLCGLFNEPGYLGTFGAFLLIIDRFRLNISNIIIFIASCFTFSLAFFFLAILFWVSKGILEKKKAPIILLTGYVLFSLIVPRLNIENQAFEVFLDRVTITGEGKLAGDNRTSEGFDILYDKTISNPSTAIFGNGYGTVGEADVIGVTTKKWIVEFGFLGFLFFFLAFFILGVKNIKQKNGKYCTDAFILLIITFISTYQRPYLYNIDNILLLFGGIYLLVQDENDKLICSRGK